MVLSTQNETYELSEDITCDTSCLFVKNTGITIDGKGHTMTFGNANNPGIQNVNFASWANSTTPSNWTVLSGTATQVTSTWPYKTYDAELSATASIKSGNVTLNAGQTYMFFAWIKGISSDSYTITINAVSDDSVLATKTMTGDYIARGFAAEDGSFLAAEQRYKPSSNTNVYLKITCSGSSVKRLAFADIKPEKHTGIAHNSYLNTNYFPDGESAQFGSTASGLTVKDINITQGSGQAVKSAALYILGNVFTGTLQNIDISMIGRNTGALHVTPSGNLVIDDVDTTTTSDAQFNRMHAPAGMRVIPASTGTGIVEIKNCNILNDPEFGLIFGAASPPTNMDITGYIHHNTIRQNEQVTEGYGFGFNNVSGLEFAYNTIQPYRGRGIIGDTSGTAWAENVEIHHNNIIDLYESGLFEYTTGGLEPVGIRLRNWGEDPLKNFSIHDNIISGSTDSNGAHAVYGININAYDPDDSIDIYNNEINISVTGSGNYGAGIAMQVLDFSLNSSPLKIRNNTIVATGNSYGISLGGPDSGEVFLMKNIDIYSNKITSGYDTIKSWSNQYSVDDIAVYCNQINNNGSAYYPFTFDGTVTNYLIDYNSITNSNSSGYEAWADANESSDVLFYGNGTIDVTGGGSVGTAGSATNGSSNCWTTAGATISSGSVSLGTVLIGQ